MTVGAYWARNLADGGIRWHELSQPVNREFRRRTRSACDFRGYEEAPPAGFEPAHTAPEADALSPELWGLRDIKGYQPQAPREHHELVGAITAREQLPSRE